VNRVRRVAAAASLALLTAGVAAVVAGCDSSTSSAAPPPAARMERIGNATVQSVVLTPLGAARVGVRTAAATTAIVGNQGGALTVVPYSALLYEPDGATAVYVNTDPLVYTRYFVGVVSINGNQVYLKAGSLPAGATVVTVGAEELLGVQNGVGVQT
jgi:hypothetical protein